LLTAGQPQPVSLFQRLDDLRFRVLASAHRLSPFVRLKSYFDLDGLLGSGQGQVRWLRMFIEHYHRTRTHLSLDKDAPDPRPIQRPEKGHVVSVPEGGGLHHRYERRAAWLQARVVAIPEMLLFRAVASD
jgi:hypothetical protein